MKPPLTKKKILMHDISFVLCGIMIGAVLMFPIGKGIGCSGDTLNEWCATKTVYINNTIEVDKQQSLISGQINTWGENMYNSSQLLFDGYVYNYGELEGKNLEITCKVYVNTDTRLVTTQHFGNIASHSSSTFEISEANFPHDATKSNAICYVSNCDNCTILDKNIPTLWSSLIE